MLMSNKIMFCCKVHTPKTYLPNFGLHKINIPKIELPKVQLHLIDLPKAARTYLFLYINSYIDYIKPCVFTS